MPGPWRLRRLWQARLRQVLYEATLFYLPSATTGNELLNYVWFGRPNLIGILSMGLDFWLFLSLGLVLSS